jgi:hypothetical protein
MPAELWISREWWVKMYDVRGVTQRQTSVCTTSAEKDTVVAPTPCTGKPLATTIPSKSSSLDPYIEKKI